MFGRRTDEPGGGGQGGNGDGEPPEQDRDDRMQERREAGESGEEFFPNGIRIETSRRRPRGAMDEEGEIGEAHEAERPPLTRYPEPMPAVPPTAGGAHRSAVYRQAPPAPDAAPTPSSLTSLPSAPAASEAVAPVGTPVAETGPQQGEQAMMGGDDSKRLTVGEGIRLKGEISNCDALVVEGNVEADLSQCRSISIGETGVFSGTVRVEEAIVAGQFQGKLVVSGVLSIKSTGRVRGEVRYGALQVEAGGVLAGSADTSDGETADEGDTGEAAARPNFGTRQAPAGDDD